MSESAIREELERVLRELGLEKPEVRLERPKDPAHGEWATNAALISASRLGRKPLELAEEVKARLDLGRMGAQRVDVAGPGFLNVHLSSSALADSLLEILHRDASYGRWELGQGRPVMVEFVSANPTGPLHLGHGRQAALGDVISNLLEWTGWRVHREFYYNDAGRQMELLALSVRARYLQLLGQGVEVPEGGYQGEYILEIAKELLEKEGERLRDDGSAETIDFFRRFAVERLRKEQDEDLSAFRVRFDRYYLESSLYTEGRVEATVRALEATGKVYRRDGALWLRTTDFGDQKDRVMIRSDGTPTYFLPDVAYHLTKWERGFHHAINVQGADHHSTVTRVRAGLQALGLPQGYPEYVLHQMVTVQREGKEVKFSKRAGSYVTLRELVAEVGVDVARYFFLMRKPEAHLVFDLDAALDQSEKNPVFKIQYAHARMCSIFRKGQLDPGRIRPEGSALSLLEHPLERDLLKRLGEFPQVVRKAAELRAPHLICDYLEQVAGAVNAWYHAGNPARNPQLAVLTGEPELREARLALARGVQIVLRNGLRILGLTAPERMERAEEVEHGA